MFQVQAPIVLIRSTEAGATLGTQLLSFDRYHMPTASKHGCERLQQRAIPDLIVTLLLDYGCRQRTHGKDLLFIDKSARKAIRRAVGGDRNMRLIEPFLNVTIIVGDNGTLVTVTRRTRRIRRC